VHYITYEENRQHGTEEFPVEFYSVNEQHPRYNMPYHWHKEAELLHIIHGEFHLSLDGSEIILKEGEICYIPGGALHGGEPSNCTYECIDFDVAVLLQHIQPIRHQLRRIECETSMIQSRFTSSEPEVLSCAYQLFSCARTRSEGWELGLLAQLYSFFGIIIQNHYFFQKELKKDNLQKVQQIKATIEYIESNYNQPITLNDLARTSGLSPKYFCRYFRMIVKRTPIDYLNYYRIERACYLLEQHAYSVTEIAYDCGFNDISYFIRCFRKYKATTPYQYVKNNH